MWTSKTEPVRKVKIGDKVLYNGYEWEVVGIRTADGKQRDLFLEDECGFRYEVFNWEGKCTKATTS